MLLLGVLEQSRRHGRPASGMGPVALAAVVAGSGSVAGMVLTARVSDVPGGVGFAVVSVASVLAGALIAAFGFGEKRGRVWYATVALSVLSVLLFTVS